MKQWIVRLGLLTLLGLFFLIGTAFLRLQLAQNEIRQQQETISSASPLVIGETQTLEILPLYEKESTAGLEHGHGVSYLIRTDSATILFDVGNNLNGSSPSPLEKNMAALGISLDEIDLIVLSHNHPDHVGGQKWWNAKTFSLSGASQPALSQPVYIPESSLTYPGGRLIVAEQPTLLAPGVATTGLISYAQPFPIWLALPKGNEQALAVNVSGRGIVLITGCGHMGLASLLQRAQTAFSAPLIGVVGGLHYGNARAEDLQTELSLVRSLNPQLVALSPHDSEATAREAFAQAFPAAYRPIVAGSTLRLP